MEKSFAIGDIKDFEVKIFLEGQCHAFLPMSFIIKEDHLNVIYCTEDYLPITELDFNDPYEVLDSLEKLLLSIKEAENYLIPLNRFCLCKESIYFSKKLNRVALIFIPINDRIQEIVFACRIADLLKELKRLILNNRTCEYITMIENKLFNLNIGREAAINYIGELKREVHICGWR